MRLTRLQTAGMQLGVLLLLQLISMNGITLCFVLPADNVRSSSVETLGMASSAEKVDILPEDSILKYQSPLSYTMDELGQLLGGTGRARACFDCYRVGVDPAWYYGKGNSISDEDLEYVGELNAKGWTRDEIRIEMGSRRAKDGLGAKTIDFLQATFGSVEERIAKLSKVTTCTDGTTKLLLMLPGDGLGVETVIIPWTDRGKSTLCISSQVGCAQGCSFCATGRMGKLRSLSSDEILAQLYWANKVCRLLNVFPVDNIVFMGLGEPADNIENVNRAASILVDPNLFELAPRKVTISTVGPSPESFLELGKSNVVLAWSVHASRDDLRKELVPTTRYSMEDLREGLIQTLQGRSKRLRNTMLEITLLENVNDAPEDAQHLVEFCKPLLESVKGIKLVVNLIPWNNIGATSGPASLYSKPSLDRVMAFQKVLTVNGILCYIRTTRGDEENAACGMLATKKKHVLYRQ